MSTDWETRHFEVADGITLVADVGGRAGQPSVILMHGGGQTRHSWHGAMQELVARDFRVVNLDARGHGESDWAPDGDYSLPRLAEDLRAVIARLPDRPALVGASMGAATALYTVGTSAEPLARALVLVDLVPQVEQAGADKIRRFMRAYPDGFANLEEVADAVSAYYPHRKRPKDPSGLMKNLRLWSDGRLHWHWDPRFIERPDQPEPPQLTDQLVAACDGVTIPSLLIRGLQSDIVSDAGVADFQALVPQLEVVNVSGAGHMVVGDKNDAFNEGLMGFLERHAC